MTPLNVEISQMPSPKLESKYRNFSSVNRQVRERVRADPAGIGWGTALGSRLNTCGIGLTNF